MAVDRQSLRKIPERILPIQIESNNQAIVLNVSDSGIGFHALNPVTQSGTIRFSFLENGERIEAIGELVWTDPSKTTGGMRFASSSGPSRERLLKWVNQPGAGPQNANAEPAAPYHPPAAPLPPHVQTGFMLFENDPQYARGGWQSETYIPDSRGKFFGGFITGIGLTAILLAVLVFTFGNPIAFLSKQRAASNIPTPLQQAVPEAPPPGAVTPPSFEPPPNSGHPQSAPLLTPYSPDDSEADPAPAQPLPTPPSAIDHGKPAPIAPSITTAAPGDDDLATAQRYLNQKTGPVGNAVAARFLWSAVQKGNVTAEITLADLYARGDGVTKNCDQARVLLRAASKKGSAIASQELAQMIRQGCR